MIRIDARIEGQEALVRLDLLPKRLRQQLVAKLYSTMTQIEGDLALTKQGRYLDPSYVSSGIEQIGSLVVGFVEAGDKPGFYSIVPKAAAALAFTAKSGDHVVTKKVYLHPFPKGGPIVERYFREKKPWILDQIEDAVFEVVYGA